jgi:uncharacterized protein (DUF302 family)
MTMTNSDRTSVPHESDSGAYGFHAHLGKSNFEASVKRFSDALKTEGFGILTEIDVQAMMKNWFAVAVQCCRPARCRG